MQIWTNWYCGLFGYSSCAAMSTFEALVMFGVLAWMAVGFAALLNFIMRVIFS